MMMAGHNCLKDVMWCDEISWKIPFHFRETTKYNRRRSAWSHLIVLIPDFSLGWDGQWWSLLLVIRREIIPTSWRWWWCCFPLSLHHIGVIRCSFFILGCTFRQERLFWTWNTQTVISANFLWPLFYFFEKMRTCLLFPSCLPRDLSEVSRVALDQTTKWQGHE